MKKMLFVLTLMFSMFFTGSVMASPIDWESNIITAVGTGVAPDYAISPGQRVALSRRAAIVDAYRNLAEVIYGVQVDNESTVEQLAVKKDTIRTSVSGLIKNARIVEEDELGNGNYRIKLAIKVFGEQNSLASAIYADKAPAIPTPVPYIKDTAYVNTAKPVTGIVVDCRGLNLDRVMSPVIRDTTGRAVYGTQHVESSWVVKNGMASYVHDESPDGLTRAGSNPIMVKAVSLDNHNWDPIISKEDADKILTANQSGDFLKRCTVVFIQ